MSEKLNIFVAKLAFLFYFGETHQLPPRPSKVKLKLTLDYRSCQSCKTVLKVYCRTMHISQYLIEHCSLYVSWETHEISYSVAKSFRLSVGYLFHLKDIPRKDMFFNHFFIFCPITVQLFVDLNGGNGHLCIYTLFLNKALKGLIYDAKCVSWSLRINGIIKFRFL